MLDLGWQELLVIGVLALLVVGPKELPGLLRNVGRWVGKARSMAREFHRSMEDAAREADLDELNKLKNVKREVEDMARVDFKTQAERSQSYLTSSKPKPAAAEGEDKPAAEAAPAPAPAAARADAPAGEAQRPAPASGEPPKSGTHD